MKSFSFSILIFLCVSCTKRYYNHYDFNRSNSTYYILPGHAGWGQYHDTAIVFLSFYELFPNGCVSRTEGLKVTIDGKQVIYLDTTGDYPIKVRSGFHNFEVETSGMLYPVKTSKFHFVSGGNYNLIFYFVNAYDDPKMRGRKRDTNYKIKQSRRS